MTPADIDALINGTAGGVTVLVIFLALILRGVLVPGYAYQERGDRLKSLEDQLPQNTAALNRAVDAFRDGPRRAST